MALSPAGGASAESGAPWRALVPPPGVVRGSGRAILPPTISRTGVDPNTVAETILFFALVISAAGLIAAILMQSRGSGLGATFGGGDASTYRSRRGVEQRLYQMTIVLAVVFVAVSMLVYIASL